MLVRSFAKGWRETTIEASIAHQHDDQREGEAPAHNHDCGGSSPAAVTRKGAGVLPEDIKDGAFNELEPADRLLHRDERMSRSGWMAF